MAAAAAPPPRAATLARRAAEPSADEATRAAEHLRRAESIIKWLRWAAIGSWVFVVPILGRDVGGVSAGFVYLATILYAVGSHWIIRRGRSIERTALGTMVGDSLAVAAMCGVTGGIDSPIYSCFYLAVLATSIRFGLRESLANAGVNTLLTLVLFAAERPALGAFELAVRPFYLFFVATLGGLLAHEERRYRREAFSERDRSRLLLTVNRAVTGTLDVAALVPRIVEEAIRAIPSAGGCVILFDRGSTRPDHVAAVGTFSEPTSAALEGSIRSGVLREAAESGRLVANDLESDDTRYPTLRAVARRSIAIVRIRHRTHLGFLVLTDKLAPEGFTAQDLDLMAAVADQAAVAIENARLLEDVVEERARKQEILRRLLHSEEEERKRLAGEIHDSLGKRLFELYYGIRQCEEQAQDDPLLVGILGRLREEAKASADEARAMMNRLRPVVVDDFGFAEALKEYVSTLRAQGEFTKVELAIDREARTPDHDANVMLFRVFHESILNARKHASARNLSIDLRAADGRMTLAVRDDGVGFDPAAVPRGHLGLLYMRERAEACGGRLEVRSAPGQGTEVEVSVPTGGAAA